MSRNDLARGSAAARRAARYLLGAMAAMLMAAVSVAGVAAHADLIAAEPAAGSSQPLLPASKIQLFAGQFVPVTGLTTVVAGSEMQVALGQPLAAATYTVQWSAATDDGHTTEGSYQFGVAPAPLIAPNLLAPLSAAIALILSAGVTSLVWLLNRRQRV
jgi:methionine-rich copper-binding protein CopC